MNTNYYFSGKEAKLIPSYIIFHELVFWCFSGFVIYETIYDNYGVHGIMLILFYIIGVWFILYYSGFKFIYYRWLMLQHDMDTTLSIDTAQQIFIYTRKEKSITFTPMDIDKWWRYDNGPGLADFVKIIEIKLKNGEHIVLSTGLEDAVNLIYYHSGELGFPEEYLADGQHARYQSFKNYIEELKQLI